MFTPLYIHRRFGLFALQTYVFALMLGGLAAAAAAQSKVDSSLVDYVRAPDASFAWTEGRTWSAPDVEIVELRVTSLTWHNMPWRHQVYMVRPITLKHPADAILLIEDGRWKDPSDSAKAASGRPPGKVAALGAFAVKLQAPIVMVMHVPPQPLLNGRNEDDALAYSFQQFLKTDSNDWPLLLPMTKSVVRAMDAVQAYGREKGYKDIERYLVTGASKRGWTTWLTAAADSRVAAIAPAIFDSLNFDAQLASQNLILGEPSSRLDSFKKYDVLNNFDSPRGTVLQQIVDPYCYRSIITQPKLITLGTNDPYWTTDSLNLYWDGLAGPKYVIYLPNIGHGGGDRTRYHGGLIALFSAMNGEEVMPQPRWQFRNEGRTIMLSIASDTPPASVQVWTTTASTADLRQGKWISQDVPVQNGAYVFRWDPPKGMYGAIYGEMNFSTRIGTLCLCTTMRRVEP